MDRGKLPDDSPALEMQSIHQMSVSSTKAPSTKAMSTKAPTDKERTQAPSFGPGDDDESMTQGEQLPEQDATLVGWDGPDDPANPQNWSTRRKLLTTISLAFCTFSVSFGSSILASAIGVLSQEYHVSPTVATLNVTVYVLGFAAGPWVWGPTSE